ncbi:replication initiator [Streptomyces sp. NPDC096311]|uniref:replication initiator n=1 Tax=Streptomyces sp. NPDC096311 TaxID=3366083 RepID=UPI00380F2FC7
MDGPDGPASTLPVWATSGLLLEAVTQAAASSFVTPPDSGAYGIERLAWGAQFDARPIHSLSDSDALSDEAVAGYVAKYVSKGAAETGAGLDYRITTPDDIRAAAVSNHTRALMGACWRLGGLVELGHLRLRTWAHSLGYRGHILTKSRRYSTTYAALRADRADHLRASAGTTVDDPDTVTESAWHYVGSGHTPGAAQLAAGIAEDLATSRELARGAVAERGWEA